jgi:hypothetical protein
MLASGFPAEFGVCVDHARSMSTDKTPDYGEWRRKLSLCASGKTDIDATLKLVQLFSCLSPGIISICLYSTGPLFNTACRNRSNSACPTSPKLDTRNSTSTIRLSNLMNGQPSRKWLSLLLSGGTTGVIYTALPPLRSVAVRKALEHLTSQRFQSQVGRSAQAQILRSR